MDAVKWDDSNERDSGLEGGGIRPSAHVVYLDRYEVYGAVDLLGEDTRNNVAEGWAGWRLTDVFRLRGGLMRIPLGTEYATLEPDLPLAGYSFTSHLDGRTDFAVSIDGESRDGALYGQAAHGFGHGFGLDGTERTGPQTSLRLMARPARLFGGRGGFLDGFYMGGAYALLGDFEDPVVLLTPPGNTVFRSEELNGSRGRFGHVDLGFAYGPVGLGLETVRGEAKNVPTLAGGQLDMDQMHAWTGTLAVSITGEERRWERGAWVAPEPLRPWGALEAALRYSNGDMDRALFDEGYTTYDPSTQEVRTFSAVLGWRPCAGLRIAFQWVKTIADDSLTVFGWPGGSRTMPRAGNDDRDSSFVMRFEFGF